MAVASIIAEGAQDERPLHRFLTYRLAMLNARVARQGGAILAREGGLKIPEWRTISLLATRGAMNGREISATSQMDAGLVSRTLRALEKRGLIAVERSDADRRVVRATLTPAGMELYGRVLPAMRRRQEVLLDALTPAERGSIFTIIEKLEMAASRPVGAAE